VIIDVTNPGNLFYIIGKVRDHIKSTSGPDIAERLEAVTKLMYDSDYEMCLRIAVNETSGAIQFWKNDEPYIIRSEDNVNVWLFGDTPEDEDELEYEIVFTPDFEVNINDDSDK